MYGVCSWVEVEVRWNRSRSWNPVVVLLIDVFLSLCRNHINWLVLVTNVTETYWDGSKEQYCKSCRLEVPSVVLDEVFSELRELLNFSVRVEYCLINGEELGGREVLVFLSLSGNPMCAWSRTMSSKASHGVLCVCCWLRVCLLYQVLLLLLLYVLLLVLLMYPNSWVPSLTHSHCVFRCTDVLRSWLNHHSLLTCLAKRRTSNKQQIVHHCTTLTFTTTPNNKDDDASAILFHSARTQCKQ